MGSSALELMSIADSHYRHLHVDALIAAVKALEALAHDRTVARLKQEPDDEKQPNQRTLSYDPASVFLLETMASISCQTSEHIEVLWYAAEDFSWLRSLTCYLLFVLGRSSLSTYRRCCPQLRNIAFS